MLKGIASVCILIFLMLFNFAYAEDVASGVTPLDSKQDYGQPESEDDGEDEGPDVCTLTPGEFFGHTFEELVAMEYVGEGYTGEETIYCVGYEEDNPELLAELKSADTNEDDELEQVEFDAWKEQRQNASVP